MICRARQKQSSLNTKHKAMARSNRQNTKPGRRITKETWHFKSTLKRPHEFCGSWPKEKKKTVVRCDGHVERASPRTYFLLDLQSIYSWGKLAENLV
jgi:hypothetical protein